MGNLTPREKSEAFSMLFCALWRETPFQNGLCEKNYVIANSMLLKLKEEDHGISDGILWMVHGYSRYQLVFGYNPELPNIITANYRLCKALPQAKCLFSSN